jgi:hypothetical protein
MCFDEPIKPAQVLSVIVTTTEAVLPSISTVSVPVAAGVTSDAFVLKAIK